MGGMPFAVAFGSNVALIGQVLYVVLQRAVGLQFDTFGFGRRRLFAFLWAPFFLLGLGRILFFFFRGLFTAHHGGSIYTIMREKFLLDRVPKHRGMNTLGQFIPSKVVKSP
ncbi:MAG: hypothetical protein BWX80_04243 [Candidatus Hydrogenedentes bacterium ADurb.Bin101]|nr:MAG: hypothetical protein BWX80_04243 [Candidatus Hydrogenedentes bacterium ADurb.Bin101]